MKRLLMAIGFCSLMISCGSEAKKTGIEAELDTYFKKLRSLKQFNGVVLVKKNEKQVLRETYNVVADDRYSNFVIPESQVDLHNISQLLAKATVMMLESDDILHATDSISQFIPNFPNGDQITIQHLLDHRSGLANELSNFPGNHSDLLPHDLIEFLRQDTLRFAPGTDSLYSEIGYELVYHIITKVTNKPFTKFIEDDIFKELRMENSGAHLYINSEKVARLDIAKKEAELKDIAAMGIPVEPLSEEEKRKSYVVSANKNLRHYPKNNILRDSMVVGVPRYTTHDFLQARLYSTIDDLALLMNFFSQKPYRPFFNVQNNRFEIIGKNKGIQLHLYHNLEKKHTFVLIGNFDAAPFDDIKQNVIAILEGKKYSLPKGKLANGVALN